jgi:hypothetical protein
MSETNAWEYLVQTFGGLLRQSKDNELQEALNEWGEQGWEVISATALENSNAMRVIAKRPLTTASRRRRSMPL